MNNRSLNSDRSSSEPESIDERTGWFSVHGGDLFGIFWVAACVLFFEIALSRLFSAVLRYHFVFLVVSIAVCGIGLGGMCQALFSRVLDRIPKNALLFGISAVALQFPILFLKWILPYRPEALWLVAIAAIAPFPLVGIYFSRILRDHAAESGRFYASDLAGAGIAALLVVPALHFFGAVGGLLAASFAFAVPALAGPSGKFRAATLAWLLTGVVVTWSNAHWNLLDVGPMPTRNTEYAKMLFAEMAENPDIRILDTRWDAFARTDVVSDPAFRERSLLIYTNGHVPSQLIRYNPDNGEFAIDRNIAEVPLEWKRPKKCLSIGPGGGMDILLVRKFGATEVDGVEINAAIRDILRTPQFRDYSGDLYGIPGVQLHIADGRAFVEGATAAYDIVFLSLAKTATGITGIALVEGYIYTVEAFEKYLERLAPGGIVLFVTDGFLPNARLFLTALEALRKRGVPFKQALRHLALLAVPDSERGRNPYEFALIAARDPIREEDAETLARLATREGYVPWYIPGKAIHPNWPSDASVSPADDEDFEIGQFARLLAQSWRLDRQRTMPGSPADNLPPIDLEPATDDRPFFLDFSLGMPPMLEPLLYGTLTALVAMLAIGWLALAKQSETQRVFPVGFGYFLCLGIAFMLVEIPLIQRLTLVLGHPVYAFCVVLFALLLGCGTGSYLSQNVTWIRERLDPAPMTKSCIAAGAISFLVSLYLRLPADPVLLMALPLRMAWAAGISGLTGVVLGIPFPAGLKTLASSGHRNLVPWMLGINGIASVTGSILAAVGGKIVGFQMVFVCGALLYLVAALLARRMIRWN